jgi:hypothetical protein
MYVPYPGHSHEVLQGHNLVMTAVAKLVSRTAKNIASATRSLFLKVRFTKMSVNA